MIQDAILAALVFAVAMFVGGAAWTFGRMISFDLWTHFRTK